MVEYLNLPQTLGVQEITPWMHTTMLTNVLAEPVKYEAERSYQLNS